MKITTENFHFDETACELTFNFNFSESMEECLRDQILLNIAKNYLGNVYNGYADDFANAYTKIEGNSYFFKF